MRYLILFLAGVALMGTLVACNTGGDATEPPPAVQTEAVAAGAEDLECTEPDEWDEGWTEYYSGGVYLSLARVDVENVTVDSVRGPIPVPETHVLSYVTTMPESDAIASFGLVCSPSDVIATTFVPLPLESAPFSCEKWAGTENRDSAWSPNVSSAVLKAEECAKAEVGP